MNCRKTHYRYRIQASVMDEDDNAMECIMWDPMATQYMGMLNNEFSASSTPTDDDRLTAKKSNQFTVRVGTRTGAKSVGTCS